MSEIRCELPAENAADAEPMKRLGFRNRLLMASDSATRDLEAATQRMLRRMTGVDYAVRLTPTNATERDRCAAT